MYSSSTPNPARSPGGAGPGPGAIGRRGCRAGWKADGRSGPLTRTDSLAHICNRVRIGDPGPGGARRRRAVRRGRPGAARGGRGGGFVRGGAACFNTRVALTRHQRLTTVRPEGNRRSAERVRCRWRGEHGPSSRFPGHGGWARSPTPRGARHARLRGPGAMAREQRQQARKPPRGGVPPGESPVPGADHPRRRPRRRPGAVLAPGRPRWPGHSRKTSHRLWRWGSRSPAIGAEKEQEAARGGV